MPEKEEVKIKWAKVIQNYFDQPLIRWIDLANGTMFRIIAFVTETPMHPKDGLFVGIERVGSFIFANNEFKQVAWDYVSEKLTVPESDARALADWINTQWGC